MTLQQLRILVCCAQTRDIESAAQQCAVSHGTIVRSLRALEEELHATLLYMRARPLAFTMQGEQLVRDATQILDGLSKGVDEIRRSTNRLVGTLRVAVSMSFGHRLVFEVLKDFARHAPEVRLDLRDVPFPSHITELQHQNLDVALLFPAWSAPSISCETLLHERVTVVLPAEHPFAKKARLRLRQLANEKWLMFYKPMSGRVGIDFYEACRLAGFRPRIAREITSPLVRLAHVELHEGITLLPSSYDSGVRRSIVRVPIHHADLSLPTAIMWNESDRQSITAAFLNSTRQTINRIYAGPRKRIEPDFENFFRPPGQVHVGGQLANQ